MFTLLLMYLGFGILSILIALPLIFGLVKPNPIYGFRVRATLENETVWYAVNRFFAQRLLLVGVVQLITAVLLYRIPGIGVDAYSLSVLFVFVLTGSIAMAQSFKYLKSIR